MAVFLLIVCMCFPHALHAHLLRNNENYIKNLSLNFVHGDILDPDNATANEWSVTTLESAKWPNGVVYYEIDSSFNHEDSATIRAAMDEFHDKTCIRWVERTDEEDFVEIENEPGCSSELGRQTGPQVLNLETPICMSKGVILHEMMHTLGFLHEISRPDRDDFVTIKWENIISGMEANFIKLTPMQLDDLGLKYDYRSVMHYSATAFSKDHSKTTILPKLNIPLNDLGLGQKIGAFTDTDLQRIRLFYGCRN